MLRATVEVRRRRVSGSDQADASRGERQRRGLGAWEGRDAARWRRRTRISRKGIVRARGVCGMWSAPRRLRRVKAWASSACGAETP